MNTVVRMLAVRRLVTLVQLAGNHQDCYQRLYRQIDAERERNSKLFAENQRLETKLEQPPNKSALLIWLARRVTGKSW